MNLLRDQLESLIPLALTTVGSAALLAAAHWLLIARHDELGKERKFARQLVMLGLTLLALLAVVLALPISDTSRGNLIGLIGIVLSGMIAFSSTTIIANLAAGMLIRITKPFRTGDFIRIGDHFGRVTERGLFDTEIQVETRELVALPNAYCISNPVTTIRSSGTIISASLSLGYDVEHTRVETLLLKAASDAELTEPFVHILELGNYAVTYRVSGFLAEPKFLISARSKLYGAVLDVLHKNQVEIMSPSFMNQRRLSNDHKSIPSTVKKKNPTEPVRSVEEIAFDKADQAENLENQRQRLLEEIADLEIAGKENRDEAGAISPGQNIKHKREQLKALELKAEGDTAEASDVRADQP